MPHVLAATRPMPRRAGNASTSVAGHRPRVIAWAGGAGCLNMVAALRPMPLARWQCLKISGTGQDPVRSILPDLGLSDLGSLCRMMIVKVPEALWTVSLE